jgi:hypothetical protein
MSIGDCQICRVLLEAASLSMKRDLEAVSKVALAVQKGIPKREIIALENHARSRLQDRENAVALYDRHLAGHKLKTMTAGSSFNE